MCQLGELSVDFDAAKCSKKLFDLKFSFFVTAAKAVVWLTADGG
jgi:hypothetical protein